MSSDEESDDDVPPPVKKAAPVKRKTSTKSKKNTKKKRTFIQNSHSHLFNKVEIHTTCMTQMIPVSLAIHLRSNTLTQAITYITLEPQLGKIQTRTRVRRK